MAKDLTPGFYENWGEYEQSQRDLQEKFEENQELIRELRK